MFIVRGTPLFAKYGYALAMSKFAVSQAFEANLSGNALQNLATDGGNETTDDRGRHTGIHLANDRQSDGSIF